MTEGVTSAAVCCCFMALGLGLLLNALVVYILLLERVHQQTHQRKLPVSSFCMRVWAVRLHTMLPHASHFTH